MRLLYAENLEYHLGGRDLLDKVSLELRLGERVALVGANGAGKTTLLRLLSGELEPSAGRIHRAQDAYLALLPQDPQYAPGVTLEAVLKSGFERLERLERELAALEQGLADPEIYHRWEELHARFEALGGYTRRSRYEAVLKGLNFAGREKEEARVLSGGEARRLALGAVLLSGADALLLDEPTNHLDLEMRAWLAEYLRSYGGALVLVSHDRHFLDALAREVAMLKEGKLRLYEGNYSAFWQKRRLEREEEERRYQTWLDEEKRLKAILEQAKAWAHSSEKHAIRKLAVEKRYEKFLETRPAPPERDTKALGMRFPALPSPERVLEALCLEKNLAGRRLFRLESLVVRRGERIALIGPNGAGKTTLLKVLLGLLPSDDTAGRVRTGIGIRVGYYDQQLSGFDPNLTLYETLYRMLGEEAHAALGAWRFPFDAQYKKVAHLSGGERARLALLSLSLQEANLLVLDEPTNHLDLETVEALEEALGRYEGTLILVSHDLFFLDRLASRTWHLQGGVFTDHPDTPSALLARLRQPTMEPPAYRREPEPPRAKPLEPSRDNPRKIKGRWHKERERERLEASIGELEARLQALHLRANTPGLGPQEYAEIAEEQTRLESDLEAQYARWEAVSLELEEG